MSVTHRRMTAADLGLVLDWAAAEGWNPGRDDTAPFHAADPDGFFIAVEDEKILAAISVVNHTDDYAFLGLYICAPEARGRGIAYELWQTAMAHAGERTIGLDGVPEQQENYIKSGFELVGSTVRHTGPLTRGPAADTRPANAADIGRMIELEAVASGVAKPRFLTQWFRPTPTRHGFMSADGTGMVVIRECRDGYKIGPLVARSDVQARNLLQAAAAIAGEADVSIDVPASDRTLTGICRELGLAPGFETARMYRGAPIFGGDLLYAVATLELG
ncbi:GNAT family N-acetyltransferase [Salipiger bermudensis]|uniref:GNAT family N-acetyltransferase n=1 Tax=Salipiger bermudensis TaxID=344736 RepID=UPI001C99D787|nr:GNAT family N-acetyltransferase [Salipiger bermudensis]MBY6004175.1 GNAT family N-acetyltransferase [Salipiger bermudensis]